MKCVRRLAIVILVLVTPCLSWGIELGRLELTGPDEDGWAWLSLVAPGDDVVRLESSGDLEVWREIGRGHGALVGYPDPMAGAHQERFYRGLFEPRTALDDWKNQVTFPDDSLRSPDPGYGREDPRWIKFAIVLDEPHRVYFQDSARYTFHYDFAAARLDRFSGMTRAEFDAVSLRRVGQEVVLGAVLFARSPNRSELAVQIVGLDPYPVEQVADWIKLVRSVIVMTGEAEFFYFPTYEQAAVAESNRGYLEGRGIRVASASRWAWGDECYSSGWALGRLVFVRAAELSEVYREGRLRPDDVLLIDAVPASVPPVAGIVTLSPATPNSHAAILAQSFGIPFVYFGDSGMRSRMQSWDGQEVLLRAEVGFGGVQLKAVNVEGGLEPVLRAELLELKAPPKLAIEPLAFFGEVSRPVDELSPGDIRYVGGKAANFGLLRRAIPANSRTPAIAITFDAWEDYMDQALVGGGTLRGLIQEKLGTFSWPPDMARLQSALEEVRELIRNGTDFRPALREAIVGDLLDAGFVLGRKIRFRSSTNVEDSEQFNGAGLYDSYSGCLGDDLMADDGGPSFCDPNEPGKRGVFRALRRVYASFYNDNAFLERLRHGLDESQVGMAVLVHYSFPDEIEMANGVATLEIEQNVESGHRYLNARMVTQLGAVSVTNPEGNALPEVVHANSWLGGSVGLELRRHSSLVPLGDTVLEWESDYRTLFHLLNQAAGAYEASFPDRRRFTLDFEYKKESPEGVLMVTQIREVPRPPELGTRVPWLVNETNRYLVFQGEHGELFAHHRLKSLWAFETANLRLDAGNIGETFHRGISAQYLLGQRLTNTTGDIRSMPNFRYQREGESFVNRWTWGSGELRRDIELSTWLPSEVAASGCPVLFLSDGRIELAVGYSIPQVAWGFNGPALTLGDRVTLVPADPVGPLSLLQTRRMEHGDIVIETSFYWPPEPTGIVAGYTAPLQGWVETLITGLSSRPIVLRGGYSQTYRPGHHNFWEEFLFDPHLEPGLDFELLVELVERNIRGVAVGFGHGQLGDLWIWGMDDTLRRP
jgi:hypothetical protein